MTGVKIGQELCALMGIDSRYVKKLTIEISTNEIVAVKIDAYLPREASELLKEYAPKFYQKYPHWIDRLAHKFRLWRIGRREAKSWQN